MEPPIVYLSVTLRNIPDTPGLTCNQGNAMAPCTQSMLHTPPVKLIGHSTAIYNVAYRMPRLLLARRRYMYLHMNYNVHVHAQFYRTNNRKANFSQIF